MKRILLAFFPLLLAHYVNAQIYTDPNTNYIGIGTPAPIFPLQIDGQAPFLMLRSSVYTLNPAQLTVKGGIIFNQENADKTAGIIEAVPPGYHVSGILFATKNNYNDPGPGTTNWYYRMFIHPDGFVGIGTTTPDQKLQVDGNIHVNDKIYFGNWWLGATGGFPTNPGFVYAGGDETFGFASSGGQISLAIDGAFRQMESGKVNYFMDKVGIGTKNPDQALTVNGTVHATEILVDQTVKTPDYVFDKDYDLASLKDVKTYIDQNHHLPKIPSAAQVAKEGINLGEMNTKLLKKIEELTLYLIQQKKDSQSQQLQIDELKNQIKILSKSK